MKRLLLAIAGGWALCACVHAAPVVAPLSSAAAHGAPAATDLVPVAPVGSATLLSDTMQDIANFVLNSAALQGAKCDGSHADAAPIQAAISAGGQFALPQGVCITGAALSLNTLAESGLIIDGAASTGQGGATANRTTIKPTSAAAVAALTDGTPFSGYVTSTSWRDLALDMTNMAAGAVGFKFGQSFDTTLSNVRVIGDTSKVSVLLGPGAFVNHLETLQSQTVDCTGNGTQNPTTLLLTNPDINSLNGYDCQNITVVGGAIQSLWNASTTPIQYVASGPTGLLNFAPTVAAFNSANGTTGGIYYAVGSSFTNMQGLESRGTDWEIVANPPVACSLTGGGSWAYGTYSDGVHGCHPIVWVVNFGSGLSGCDISNGSFAGEYPLGAGVGGLPNCRIGTTLNGTYTQFEGVPEIFNGTMSVWNSQATHWYSDQGATQTAIIDGSVGKAQFLGETVQPATNGSNFFFLYDAPGSGAHSIFGCYAGGSRASDTCFGSNLTLYQDDAGAVPTLSLNGQTGVATMIGQAFSQWPILVNDPQVVFLWSTQSSSSGISTYQDILALGDQTLNPTTHTNPIKCTGTGSNAVFCGDEIAFGPWTLHSDIDGRDNTAVGDHALTNLTHGLENVAVGSSALANIRGANDITGVGTSACQDVTETAGPLGCWGVSTFQNAGSASQYADALGFQAALNATNAQFSLILGASAAPQATTITDSTILGVFACDVSGLTSITNSVCITPGNAFGSGPAVSSLSNKLVIGGTTPLIYGDFSTGQVAIHTASFTSGAALSVAGGVAASFVRGNATTYAGLSTADPSPSVGDQLVISDASACTINTAVTAGGGSTHSCPVVYTGSWVALVTH